MLASTIFWLLPILTLTSIWEMWVESRLTIQGSFPIHRITFAITIPKCFVLFLHELIPKLLDQRLDNEAANVHLDHLKGGEEEGGGRRRRKRGKENAQNKIARKEPILSFLVLQVMVLASVVVATTAIFFCCSCCCHYCYWCCFYCCLYFCPWCRSFSCCCYCCSCICCNQLLLLLFL